MDSATQETILQWFVANKRDLPWRNTTPWGVMMSEFMLQQTPVHRVLPVWERWISRWPDPRSLADASKGDLITEWGRLGYPRRALRLHESAQLIANEHHNRVPDDPEILRQLPGVGEYTAAAIAVFGYHKSHLVLDINIRRFFARYIDGQESPKNSMSNSERESRRALIPRTKGAQWAAATMEFGALICTARNPSCEECPLSARCAWRLAGYPLSEISKRSQGWHGTDRQCRGTIVQALRENPRLDRQTLDSLWRDTSQIERALYSLMADGLIIQIEKDSFALPQ